MTYNRMKAVSIPGKHCYLCGRKNLSLVKTKCCEQWVCCDTQFVSFSGGGYCQFQHEQYSICHFHYNEKHSGIWQECSECLQFFGKIPFEEEVEVSRKPGE